MADRRRKLNTVRFIFKNKGYNYITSVSSHLKEEDARKYFVGQTFDVGRFPKEDLQKVIDIEFFDENKDIDKPTKLNIPDQKEGTKRKGSEFMRLQNEAKENNANAFTYKGKTYNRRLTKTNLVYYKKSFWS